MRNFIHLIFILAGLTLLLFLSTNYSGKLYAQAKVLTKDRVKEIVKEYITSQKNPNAKIVGSGSWISGGKYKDPLTYTGIEPSDHDMRIFLPQGTSKADALKEWQTAQTWIKSRVKQEFGDKADDILKSINIYPPDQLLDKVDSYEDAKSFFSKLGPGKSPNLGGGAVEGLWKNDSKAFKQFYEESKGMAFYYDTNLNRAIGSSADLDLLQEGRKVFTIGNSASLADEWIEHLSDALKNKDPRTAGKYLQRLDDAIKKGKSLGRTKHGDYMKNLLPQIKAAEEAGTELSDDLIRQINRAVKQAELDSGLLKQLSKATDPSDITLITKLLGATDEGASKLRMAMLEDMANNIPAETLFKGVFILFDAYQAFDASESGDNDKALRKILETAMAELGAGPLVWGVVMNMIIEDAKTTGYSMVSGRQDCEDLLAGICDVAGRRDATGFQQKEMSLDEIVNRTSPPYNEKQFYNIIATTLQTQARACTTRGAGPETLKTDRNVEETLVDRCKQNLVTIFNQKRLEKMAKIAMLESEFFAALQSGDIQLFYDTSPVSVDPNNYKVTATVYAENNSSLQKASEILKEMQRQYKQVAGPQSYIKLTVIYKWFKDSQNESVNEEKADITGVFFNNDKAKITLGLDQAREYNVILKYIVKVDYVIGLESLEDNTISDAIRQFNMDQIMIKDTGVKIAIETKLPEQIVKGEVQIIGPDTVDKGDMITLKAVLGDTLKNQSGLKINWYMNEKEGQPLDYGPEVTREADKYYVALGEKYTAIVVVTKDTPNGVIEVAETRKEIIITVKSRKDQIEAAFQRKDWKKLYEISQNIEREEDIKLLISCLKQLATEFQAENTKMLAELKIASETNKKQYKTYADNLSNEMKAVDNKLIAAGEDSEPVINTMAKCSDINGEKYVDLQGKLDNAIGHLEAIEEEYNFELANLDKELAAFYNKTYYGLSDPENASFFNINEEKKDHIPFEFNKPIQLLSYEYFCDGKYSKDDLAKYLVKLKTSKQKAKPGEIISIEALINSKDSSPVSCGDRFKYEWSGSNITTSGDFASSSNVDFVSSKNGNFSVGVTIRCGNELIGRDSATINVGGGITGLVLGLENEVLLGSSRNLRVRLQTDDADENTSKTVDAGSYDIYWNSQPELDFNPISSSDGTTTVSFNRMQSPIQIWADIKQKGSNDYIGRTDNFEVKVIAPKFQIKYTPDKQNIKVGETFKAEVITDPEFKEGLIDYRWVEPSDAINLGGGKIEFTPKENKAVKLKAIARIPVYGDIINDNISDQLMPGAYKVIASLKDGSKLYKVDENIAVIAGVEGIEENQVSFNWNVNANGKIIQGGTTKEAIVQRGQAGSGVATVSVYDKMKNKLGEASVTFEVESLTAEEKQKELEKQKQQELAKENKETLALTEKALQEGKLDEAEKALEAALQKDPQNAEIAEKLKEIQSIKAIFNQHLEKAKQLMAEGKFEEARKELALAKQLNPESKELISTENDMHYKELSYNDSVYSQIAEASGSLSSRYYKETLEKVAKIKATQQLDQKQITQLNDIEQQAKESLERYEKAGHNLAQAESLYNAYDFKTAIPVFDVGLSDYRNLMPANETAEGRQKDGQYHYMRAEAQRKIDLIASYLNTFIIPAANKTDATKESVTHALELIAKIEEIQPPNPEAKQYKSILEMKLKEASQKKEDQQVASQATSGQSWGKANTTSASTSGQSWGKANTTSASTSGQSWGKANTTSASTSGQSWGKANTTSASTSGQSWGKANTTSASTSGQSWGSASTTPSQPVAQIQTAPVKQQTVVSQPVNTYQQLPVQQPRVNTQQVAVAQNFSGSYYGSISGESLTGNVTLTVNGTQARINATGKMKVFSQDYNYSFSVSGTGTVHSNGKININSARGQLSGMGEVINVSGSMSGMITNNTVNGIWSGQAEWTETGTWSATKR